MNKFVKLKGYPEYYFMVISKIEELPSGISDTMQKRIETVVGNELLSKKEYCPQVFFGRFHHAVHNKPNYAEILNKYVGNTLLIRPIGSFMFLQSKHEIEDIVYAEDFPEKNIDAKIVVCENDMEAEPEWIKYLKERFPEQKIRVLNFFKTRTEESLKISLTGVDLITFSTTFSNFDWFKKAINCSNNQKFIGYCHNPDNWDEAKLISGNRELEIVDKL
jgi:hypothetical protein